MEIFSSPPVQSDFLSTSAIFTKSWNLLQLAAAKQEEYASTVTQRLDGELYGGCQLLVYTKTQYTPLFLMF